MDGLRVLGKIPLKREQLQIISGWEIRAPATPDDWYPVVGYDLPIGFDLLGSFKDVEPKMVSIVGFSKGGK
nr:L323 [uncultured bacterium]